jgi:3-isopropylmalate/(R)-2-methylmalate dehydratase small subunit
VITRNNNTEMEPLKKIRGIVAPIDRTDVDTDQIIPKQFLKKIERTGFGEFLFYDWRYKEDGTPNPDFVLNKPLFRKSTILLARKNFGTGSSREHAVWALYDFGFRVIISPKFADIFYNNAFKNGLALITLPEETVDQMFQKVYELEKQNKPYYLTVDIEEQVIYDDFGFSTKFEMDPIRKMYIVEGLDEIGMTLKYEDKIKEYEEKRKKLFPFREISQK